MAKLMKNDVISSVVDKTDLSKKDATAAVEAFTEIVSEGFG